MPAAKKAAKKSATKPAAKKASVKKAAPKKEKPGRITGMKMGDGMAPVVKYWAKIPPEHRAIAEAIDQIAEKSVPGMRRALKWSTPMYGVEGRGWFMGVGSFKTYVKVNFFKGAAFKPVPPEGEGKEMRSINIPSLADLDRKQMTAWVKQAGAIPGWGK